MNYAIVSLVSMMIHVILNHEFFSNREAKTTVNRDFKWYLWSVLGYYVVDAAWGIAYDFRIPALSYVMTLLYYFVMALSVVLLCRYVATYLKLKSWFGKILTIFGFAFAAIEISLLVINQFVHIFFSFDEQGTYHAYVPRYLTLYLQVILCVILAIETGIVLRKTKGDMHKRYLSIFLFCIEMTIAIAAQIVFPLIPLYAIGLVVGNSLIHSFVKADEKTQQYKVLLSMADIFYSMHVIDLVNDSVEELHTQKEIREIVNHEQGAIEMMDQVISKVVTADYLEEAKRFTDLTTVAERMKNKKVITTQFIGKRVGWVLAMAVAIETDDDKKPTKIIFATRDIEEEKREQEHLLYQSRTDELTGLYNRRAYEEDIYELDYIPDEFTYIALDVNGLKDVNDSIGHAAGDELLIGASDCMKKVFGAYGKIYRTGGDEFVATTFIDEKTLRMLLRQFDEVTANWSGKLVGSISIAYGCVSKKECPNYSMHQFATEADKRMYLSKGAYYRQNGTNRRGQKEAYKTLCETYTKILKINLTEDSYQIIGMLEEEKDTQHGFADRISIWLKEFGLSGQVHEDDLKEYLEKTNLAVMREYFHHHDATYIVLYRRKYGDTYKRVMLEVIPASDYTPDNQLLYLYVKNIE